MESKIRYSCFTCHTHFELDMADKEPKCPQCGEIHIIKRCEADPAGGCKCLAPVSDGIHYCPICKRPICPRCGDHDVETISRVTGYLQAVSGWNSAKQEELRNRVRTQVVGGELMT